MDKQRIVLVKYPRPKREKQWQMEVRGRACQERGLVGGRPDFLGAPPATIQPSAALERIFSPQS
jgi:hypothetical protein